MVKSKLIYTLDKKRFALSAAYANVKRQVKTRGSWMVIRNFYSMNLFSDSSIIPKPLSGYYGKHWDGFNKMNVYAFSAGLGGTRTLYSSKNFSSMYLPLWGLKASTGTIILFRKTTIPNTDISGLQVIGAPHSVIIPNVFYTANWHL